MMFTTSISIATAFYQMYTLGIPNQHVENLNTACDPPNFQRQSKDHEASSIISEKVFLHQGLLFT